MRPTSPSHTRLNANGKTGLKKQNCGWGESKNETACKIERLQINMDKKTTFQIKINSIHKL
jgi:hypothetical protein